MKQGTCIQPLHAAPYLQNMLLESLKPLSVGHRLSQQATRTNFDHLKSNEMSIYFFKKKNNQGKHNMNNDTSDMKKEKENGATTINK